ncbi:MAG: hypothetical protein DI623_02175 [Sphingomonas sanxanigenens]|uniref:Uncharacterized protein n=1 Tax=Sphingomonas sanxanigenens TaxID=397260 RepID=A0A2W5AEJ7_9SPHN|nr:MAG: hypothetical protein DI623_02175 [Sphingomonas sanxanigenens]
MLLLARLLLLVPSIVAGWFVSREDPRFWVIALVVALTFMALSIIAGIYAPALRFWPSRRK